MMNWILKCLDEPGRLKTQVWRIIVPKPDSERRERNSTLKNFRLQRALMNAYEGFEQLVALALSLISGRQKRIFRINGLDSS